MRRRAKIGAFTYDVRYDPKLQAVGGVLGTCLSDSLIILIDQNLPDEVEAETILHEVMHASWAQTGLRKRFGEEDEEFIIWQLSPLIFGFLREPKNRSLVEWLLTAGR